MEKTQSRYEKPQSEYSNCLGRQIWLSVKELLVGSLVSNSRQRVGTIPRGITYCLNVRVQELHGHNAGSHILRDVRQ